MTQKPKETCQTTCRGPKPLMGKISHSDLQVVVANRLAHGIRTTNEVRNLKKSEMFGSNVADKYGLVVCN